MGAWRCLPQELGCCPQPCPSRSLQPHLTNPRAVPAVPCSLPSWLPLAGGCFELGCSVQLRTTIFTARLPASSSFGHLLGCAYGWLWGLKAIGGSAKGDAILAGSTMTLLHKGLVHLGCPSAHRASELWQDRPWMMKEQKMDPGACSSPYILACCGSCWHCSN